MVTFDSCEFSSIFSTSAPASLLALLGPPLAPDHHHHHHEVNDDDDCDDDGDDDDDDEKGEFTSLFPLAQRGQQVSAARS